MKYADLSVKTYLKRLASKSPVPGGGSTAALFGAIGCALLEMVVNYSDKRIIKKSAAILKNTRGYFLRLMDEDITAYDKFSLCYKRYGKDSYKTQVALKKATFVPLKICSKSYEMTRLCGKLQNAVNKNLISDVACAKTAFSSAFKSAKLNVDVNIKNIKDKKWGQTLGKRYQFLVSDPNKSWQKYWMAKS
ncbi:MAG: cyclodeaminase/cyclohydrolase family protein [Candidatus Omnitrophota bacterium]|nr:MAG: cyclodeaminase/cyclohydrolase family protein [Candidatus Omnitrophota bacterium]